MPVTAGIDDADVFAIFNDIRNQQDFRMLRMQELLEVRVEAVDEMVERLRGAAP